MSVHLPLVQSCDDRKGVLVEMSVAPLVMAKDEEGTQWPGLRPPPLPPTVWVWDEPQTHSGSGENVSQHAKQLLRPAVNREDRWVQSSLS